jgi:uncharacterized protein YbcC (UPF0753/DUF2309 family)
MINHSKSIEEASQGRRKDMAFVFFCNFEPLSGYEGMPFEKQLIRHEILMRMFFQNPLFRQAWEKGEIDENILLKLLEKINC